MYCINVYFHTKYSLTCSSQFCYGSQSAIGGLGPHLYSIFTLYWCIPKSMCWSLCVSMATSFLRISTTGLWPMMILTSLAKQYWWHFSSLLVFLVPHMLYCCIFALVRPLLGNTVNLRMQFSGASSCGQLRLSVVSSNAVPSPTPDVSLSKYVVLSCHKMSCMHLLLLFPCWSI